MAGAGLPLLNLEAVSTVSSRPQLLVGCALEALGVGHPSLPAFLPPASPPLASLPPSS